ncbi:MAG TPA: protein kinase, partial [Byssovorax sp.]
MSETVCPQCGNPCEQAHKFCPVCGFPISELSRKTDDPLIGTTLPGGYVILDLVGVGGMGRVYRAEQKALGRTVAVKIIHPHLLGDESASVRFITEARAASRLNHPNSVGVIDFGKNGSQLYLVMEFLRGRDLARVIYEDGPLPFKRIVEVLCQVLAALAEAHHLDIIHRDLKPENVVLEPMRTGGDFVKVVDFGLAKMKQDITATNITSPGIVCGTPDYMAPEQGRGDAIDARSDLYACGVILFQLLTGRLPFEAESPTQVVLMHLSLPPPDPATIAPEREIPDALVDVTMRSLEKDPSRRFQTADEFAQALRDALAASDTTSGRFSLDSVGGVACTSCGTLVPRGQKFCGDCGARVVATGSPAPSRTSGRPGFTQRRGRESSLPRLPVPFTAREEDLDWLGAARIEVETSLQAARLVADHGVGKSRLLNEFLVLAAREGDVIVQVGPDPWWAEVGNYALREAITGLAALPPGGGDPADWGATTPEARRGLSDIFGRESRRDTSRPHVWTKPPSGTLTPEEKRFIAAEALRWAMTRAHQNARRSRVLLAIDDLHAVDGSSRNAFADVINEPPLAPMLILGAHVPGFDPGWRMGGVRNLAGLPTTVAASLVKGSGAPKAQGNDGRAVPPLYIDQLIRFNLEGGSDPPPRMADIIALRIERLPIEARRTLQAVAVLGDAADRPGISALAPELTNLDDLIATLGVAGLLVETVAGIRIAHPLVRDVTLATIPAGVRRELHATAHGLTPANGPQPLEVRALHAYHAQDSFEALMLLEQVADRAASRGDQQGCVLALRRGLDLSRREIFRGELDDPMRAVLIFCRKLGEALAHAGDLTDADGVLREALDLAGPSGPDRAVVLGALAYVSHERQRGSEATMYLREALD